MNDEADRRFKDVDAIASKSGFDDIVWAFGAVVREAIKPSVDDNGTMDSGGTADVFSLWPKYGGTEFYVTIQRSRKQRIADGTEQSSDPFALGADA